VIGLVGLVPLKDEGSVKDPITISAPLAWASENLWTLEASARMATRLKLVRCCMSSFSTGPPMKPLAPIMRTEGESIDVDCLYMLEMCDTDLK
jgi:hypothetical protein